MYSAAGGPPPKDKTALYERLAKQLRALLEGSGERTANAANTSALLYQTLPRLNWAGFYFIDASGQNNESAVVGADSREHGFSGINTTDSNNANGGGTLAFSVPTP